MQKHAVINADKPGAYLGGHWVMAPLLILLFSKKRTKLMVSSDGPKICQTLLMIFVAYGQWRIHGGRMRGSLCILHPATFKNVFDVCSFSIVSNLFDQ